MGAATVDEDEGATVAGAVAAVATAPYVAAAVVGGGDKRG